MAKWKRTGDCLLCGGSRCMVDGDSNDMVGYCFRLAAMHRNGKVFTKSKKPQHGKFAGGSGGVLFESIPPVTKIEQKA